MAFIGITEVDYLILLYLPDEDLRQIPRLNKYFYALSQDNYLWQEKLRRTFGYKFLQAKHSSLTWKEWYFFWSKHNYGITFIQELNLTPEQGFISLSSNRLYCGAEAFQSIGLTLGKALLSNDKSLLNYFTERYRKYVNSLVKITRSGATRASHEGERSSPSLPHDLRSRSMIIELPNYSRLIDIALRIGNKSLAKEFIDDLIRIYTSSTFDLIDKDDDLARICRILGQHGFSHHAGIINMLSALDMDLDEITCQQSFLEGLIEGHHNDEAILSLESLAAQYNLEYECFFKRAYYANNYYMMSYMKDKVVERIGEELKKYNMCHSSDKISIINADDYLRVASQHNDFDISKYLEYRLNNVDRDRRSRGSSAPLQSSHKKSPVNTLDYLNSSWETLKSVFDNSENSREKSKIIVLATKFGRSDFILKCDFRELSSLIARDVAYSMINSCYRGLALYVLLQIAKYYPEIYNDVCKLSSDLSGNYEMLDLISELSKISIEELPKTNFYALLMKPYSSS